LGEKTKKITGGGLHWESLLSRRNEKGKYVGRGINLVPAKFEQEE